METSVQRLKQYLEAKGVSPSAFYSATGLSNGYLNNVKVLGADKLEIILRYYPDLNALWIITGKGSMYNPKTKNTGYDAGQPGKDTLRIVQELEQKYNVAVPPPSADVNISLHDLKVRIMEQTELLKDLLKEMKKNR